MNNINRSKVILAISALVVGLLLGWLIFGKSSNKTENERSQNSKEASVTIWTCSMHPQIRQTEPGDCPICGMELVPLESEHDESDPRAVRMSETAMALAKVQTLVVGAKGSNTGQIRLFGKVQPDERKVVSQTSHLAGRIEELSVNTTGEFVVKGQELAKLYSPELVLAQQELLEAQKIAKQNPEIWRSAKSKLKNWKLTDGQIKSILEMNEPIEKFPILADQSGIVLNKYINNGDYIKAGAPLYEIADLTSLWVLFDVYESELDRIKVGDSIEYSIRSLPGRVFMGAIDFVDPVIDPSTRVARARIALKNQDELLKPEMFAEGVLKSDHRNGERSDEITVPKTAVMWTGKRSVVYVMQQSSEGVSFLMREVTLGAEIGDSYELTSGLEYGEEIAVKGTFSIDAAAQLAGKPSMMNPSGGQPQSGHHHQNMDHGQMESTESPAYVNISNEASSELQSLFSAYMSMKTALANDDFSSAKKAGEKLKEDLNQVQSDIFNAGAHHTWLENSSALKASLEHISHQSSIEGLRESFFAISGAMIDILRVFRPMDQTIYIQHCPMANSDNGADWLSDSKEIRNPYFGASMLKCGETTDSIKTDN